MAATLADLGSFVWNFKQNLVDKQTWRIFFYNKTATFQWNKVTYLPFCKSNLDRFTQALAASSNHDTRSIFEVLGLIILSILQHKATYWVFGFGGEGSSVCRVQSVLFPIFAQQAQVIVKQMQLSQPATFRFPGIYKIFPRDNTP